MMLRAASARVDLQSARSPVPHEGDVSVAICTYATARPLVNPVTVR